MYLSAFEEMESVLRSPAPTAESRFPPMAHGV
jgi:hypothetical protein